MLAQRGQGVTSLSRDDGRDSGKTGGTASAAEPAKPRPERRRMANKDKYALKLLPGEIDALSETIADLEKQLEDPELFKDSVRFAAVSQALADAMQARSEKEDRWLELEALREEIEGGD